MVTGIFCFMEARFQNWQTLPDATLAASYPAWGNVLNVGPDKALTPHPVTPNLTDDAPASLFSAPQIYYSWRWWCSCRKSSSVYGSNPVTVGNDIQFAVDFQAAAGVVEHLRATLSVSACC